MSIKYCCYGMYCDIGHSDDCPTKTPRAEQASTAAPAQAEEPSKAVAFIGRLDFETLQSRGRCTLTAYNEPVGNNSNEVPLYTHPPADVALRQTVERLLTVIAGLLEIEDARIRTGAFRPNAEAQRRIDAARDELRARLSAGGA